MTENTTYSGPALFSYGFRPFFLSAAVFAGIVIPVWTLVFSGAVDIAFLFAPRDWHVHEMVFGFLPCVLAGFLFTAIPNWTDRPPIRGRPLMLFSAVWLAGRLVALVPEISHVVAAVIDGMFLVMVAGCVWREIALGRAWERLPIGIAISLYATTNILFHVLSIQHAPHNLATRMALAVMMILLTLIGGRITPGFTHDFMTEHGMATHPVRWPSIDRASIALVGIAGLAWTIDPQTSLASNSLAAAGFIQLIRLIRWRGWMAWQEPLVLILHIGYAWLAISLMMLGGAIAGMGVSTEDSIHALTTGAVGTMTLAVMTRASLGHTGRPRRANAPTVMIYALVNLGAFLRVFGPSLSPFDQLLLNVAAGCWSGAYLLFAAAYGPILVRAGIDEAS